MRWMLGLGFVAVVACSSDSLTLPSDQETPDYKQFSSILLPSASDPSVSAIAVCGQSYSGEDFTAPPCNGYIADLDLFFPPRRINNPHFLVFNRFVEAERHCYVSETVNANLMRGIRPNGVRTFAIVADACNESPLIPGLYFEVFVLDGEPVNFGLFHPTP